MNKTVATFVEAHFFSLLLFPLSPFFFSFLIPLLVEEIPPSPPTSFFFKGRKKELVTRPCSPLPSFFFPPSPLPLLPYFSAEKGGELAFFPPFPFSSLFPPPPRGWSHGFFHVAGYRVVVSFFSSPFFSPFPFPLSRPLPFLFFSPSWGRR